MEKLNLCTQLNPKSYLRFGLTILLILYAGKFIINDALPYFGFDKETFGRYWNFKWSLIGHIAGGILALAIGYSVFKNISKQIYDYPQVVGTNLFNCNSNRYYKCNIFSMDNCNQSKFLLGFCLANVSICVDCDSSYGLYLSNERSNSSTQGMDDTKLCGDFCFC